MLMIKNNCTSINRQRQTDRQTQTETDTDTDRQSERERAVAESHVCDSRVIVVESQ